jgi:hypothetical protein
MPDVITERWSDRKYNSKTATRSFDVPSSLAFANLYTAQQLVADLFGCAINAGHPWNPWLRVTSEGPVADQSPGFSVIRVTVNYELANFTDPTPPAPLKIRWGVGGESIETDVDIEGNPIVNTAGDTFSRLFNRDDLVIHLDVTTQILPATFNAARSVQYADTYNSDTVGVFGYGTLAPGQMKCVSIMPAQEYSPGDATNYIDQVFKFELKKGNVQDPDGVWDAFKYRLVSVGNNGWAVNPATSATEIGPFVKNGNLKTNVLLGVTGIPIDSTIQVQFAPGVYATPVANPRPVPGKYLEVTGAAFAPNAVFLKYKKRLPQPFAALGIF